MSLGAEEAELKALESAFKTAWNATTYPYVLGDDAFKGERTKSWVRLSVTPIGGDRADLGGDTTRHEFPGILQVQCFIVQQGATAPDWVAAALTQRVRAIYQDKQFLTESGGHIVTFTTARVRAPQEKSWVRYNINTPFRRDEFFQ